MKGIDLSELRGNGLSYRSTWKQFLPFWKSQNCVLQIAFPYRISRKKAQPR